MKKTLITVLVTVLVCFGIVGTTYAWLVAKTAPLKNTFTAGNINITLSESTSTNRKMVPGAQLEENPKVTVKANSEDCWLFIRLDKSQNFDTFLSFEMEEGWTAVGGERGIYYREVFLNENTDQEFFILKDNLVKANDTTTKQQYDALGELDYPLLTLTAYAVQKKGFDTVSAAWTQAKTLDD